MAGQGSGAAPKIFISYRREDSEDSAGRLCDALVARFGAEQVFMDVDTIPLGADFTKEIAEAVGSCDVLLAVIGPGWLSAEADGGGRRLDDPNDFVRLEIKSALKRDVRVIPTLIHGTKIPAAGELPKDIAALSHRNGIQLRSESWRHGVEQLINAIEPLASGKRPSRPRAATKKPSRSAKKRSAAPKASQPSPSPKRSNPPPAKTTTSFFVTKPEDYQVKKSSASTSGQLALDVLVGGKTHVVEIARDVRLFTLGGPVVRVDETVVAGTKALLPQIALLPQRPLVLPPALRKDLDTKPDAAPAEGTWWSYTFGFYDVLTRVKAELKLRTIAERRLDLSPLATRLGITDVVIEVRLELDGRWLYWSR